MQAELTANAKILAIDTSTENCSVALMFDNQCITRSEVAPRDHTKKILPMVDEVLREAGLKLTDLDALAYGQGPGSFTGVRIGIGIAQGLAFGAELPMIGISTLKAMAQGSYRIAKVQNVAVAIDARMSEVYWAQYQRLNDGNWQSIGEEAVMPPQEIVEALQDDQTVWTEAGTGWAAYDELAQVKFVHQKGEILYPEAEDIAFLAQYSFAKNEVVDADSATPVYLRDKVAWKKLPGRE